LVGGARTACILTLPDRATLIAQLRPRNPAAGQKSPKRKDGMPGDQNHSYLCRSTDHGKTWARCQRRQNSAYETAILRLHDGRIIAAARTRLRDLVRTDSTDGGRTWSKLRSLAPIDVHPADLTLLPDGRILLTLGANMLTIRGKRAYDRGKEATIRATKLTISGRPSRL